MDKFDKSDKQKQQRYNIGEAVQFIVEPGEESELSELEESDIEDVEIQETILDDDLCIKNAESNEEDNNEEQQTNQEHFLSGEARNGLKLTLPLPAVILVYPLMMQILLLRCNISRCFGVMI